jgi:hypothetical protein
LRRPSLLQRSESAVYGKPGFEPLARDAQLVPTDALLLQSRHEPASSVPRPELRATAQVIDALQV